MKLKIVALREEPTTIDALADLLVETVASGGSVSFLHPLPTETAVRFWNGSLAAAGRGERAVLGAYDDLSLIGTVTLLLDLPPNQPHRAEIAKMMVCLSHRHRGVGTALMRAAEAEALARGRTHLVLDTAVEDGASALYESLGFMLAGVIPEYALKPHGGLTGTMLYWKRIRAANEVESEVSASVGC